MNLDKLNNILNNEPSFRLKQIKKLIFQDLITEWSQATVLPLVLREKLDQQCPLTINGQKNVSHDQSTIKTLINLSDGLKIETVLMKHGVGRHTVCASSQVGCRLGCAFCATGKMGFKRNLESDEIVEQILFYARELRADKKRVDSVVFMGMGEPFENYDNVLSAVKILNDQSGLNIGARHISISTVGIPDGIKKLSQEPLQINLALSLHAPNDALRSQIIPFNKAHNIEAIFQSIAEYIKQTNRRVMIEYMMIDNFNDSLSCAKELVQLIKTHQLSLCFINLISYNPTGFFQSSSPAAIKNFKTYLKQNHVAVTERYRFGQDIDAACGQLVA